MSASVTAVTPMTGALMLLSYFFTCFKRELKAVTPVIPSWYGDPSNSPPTREPLTAGTYSRRNDR